MVSQYPLGHPTRGARLRQRRHVSPLGRAIEVEYMQQEKPRLESQEQQFAMGNMGA